MELPKKHISRAWWVTPLLILIILWGVGHSSYVLTRVANSILSGLVTDGSSFSVGQVEGSVFGNLLITEFAVASDSDSTAVSIDSLRISYSLLDAIQLRIASIKASSVVAKITRNANGDFILPAFTESEGSAPDVELGTVSIQTLTTRIIQQDSLLAEIADGALNVSALRLGSEFSVNVDTLWAKLWYPKTASSGLFKSSLAFGNDIGLRTSIALDTELSHVQLFASTVAVAVAVAVAPNEQDSLAQFPFDLSSIAAWKAFGDGHLASSDLSPFVPGLTDREVYSFSVETTKNDSTTSTIGSLESLYSGTSSFVLHTDSAADSTKHYLSLQFADLNPSASLSTLAAVNDVSGTLEVEAVGNSIQEAHGTSSLRLDSGGFDRIQMRPSTVHLTFGNGQYGWNGALASNAGNLSLSGRYQEVGAFTANGEMSRINLAQLVEGQEASSINASFSASGDIKEARTSAGSLRLQVKPSKVASCDIDSGRLTAALSNNRATFSTDVTLCAASSFEGEGTVQRVFDQWTASLKGAVDGLRVSELVSMENPVELSSEFSLSLTSTGKINGDVLLSNLQFEGVQVDSLKARFSGNDKSLAIHPSAIIGGGRVAFEGVVSNFNAISIRSGTVTNVDVFAVGFSPVPAADEAPSNSSSVNGSFSGDASFLDGGMRGAFDLILENTQLNRSLFAGRSRVGLSSEAIQVAIDLQSENAGAENVKRDAPNGQPILAEQAHPSGSLEGTIDVDLNQSSLTSTLALSSFDPLPALNMDGSAYLTGEVRASAQWIDELTFDGSIALEGGSTFNQATFESVNGSASGSSSALSGAIELKLGRGDVRADYSWQNETLEALLQVGDADIAALLGIDSPSSLSANLRVIANMPQETYDLDIARWEGHFEGTTWNDGRGRLSISPSAIVVDSLLIPGSFGKLFAHGKVPRKVGGLESDLTFDVRLNHELASLEVFKSYQVGLRDLQLEGNLAGPAGATRLISSFSARNLSTPNFSVDQLSGRILGELNDSLRFAAAELTSDLKLIEVSPSVAESGRLSLSFDGVELVSTLDVSISEGRHFDASLGWAPFEQPEIIRIIGLSALIDGSTWSLTGMPVINLDRLYLEKPLVLSAGDQRIVAVSAPTGINDDGETLYRNLVTIQQVNIDPFADIATFPELGGQLSGTLSSSMVGNKMHLQGTLFGTLTAYHQPVGTLNTQFNYDGSTTRLSASLKDANEESIQLSGSIPGFSTEEQVQIQLSATSYSIDWIRSLLDPGLIDDLKGKVNGEVLISGTSKQPNWSGLLKISEGQLGIPELGKRKGMVVQNIQGNFRFDGEVINVDSLRARSGDGWLEGSGTIDIRDLKLGEYNITLSANDFKAIDSPDYFAVVSGKMQLGGTTDRPRISGRLIVHRGDFWLSDATTSDAFAPLALSEQDLATLQRRFGLRIAATDTTSFDAYDVLALENFTVRMERDTWIRSKSNPKLDIQLTGDLDVRKKPKEDPEVFGSISILPERSRIIQFGKRFEMERGELTFNGPMAAPNLNMEASYTVPSRGSETEEVTIRLIAQGTPDNLDVSFDSDPAMELADIISYIATGRPAAASLQISGAQSDTYLQTAAGLAMGPVTDLIENLAGAGLGLDVIEIEHTGFSGLTLTAGKYVSPRLYVSVSQPIALSASTDSNNATNKNQTQVTIEYELVQQLLLSLLNRGTILRVNLRWQHAF